MLTSQQKNGWLNYMGRNLAQEGMQEEAFTGEELIEESKPGKRLSKKRQNCEIKGQNR